MGGEQPDARDSTSSGKPNDLTIFPGENAFLSLQPEWSGKLSDSIQCRNQREPRMVMRSRIVWENKRSYLKILKTVPRIDAVEANRLENKADPEYV